MMDIEYTLAHPTGQTGTSGRQAWRAGLLAAMLGLMMPWLAVAADAGNTLQAIKFSSLPGNRVEVDLVMSGTAAEPRSFTIDNPARIALDFADTASSVEKKNENVGIGMVRSVTAVQSRDRTRVVLNMVRMVGYQARVEGSHVYITVDSGVSATAPAPVTASVAPAAGTATATHHSVKEIDFRRGERGTGRIMVTLSDAAAPVDVRTEGGKLVVEFDDTTLPRKLQRRLEVTDFATPVTYVDAVGRDNRARIVVTASGDFEHLAYQADNLFTLEVKPVSKAEKEAAKKDLSSYTGDKLSLNFQNIEVRAVLQVIADFTNTNMVVSDTVTGNISLRLKDVPWDQALDIILHTKGLGMRQMGNVMLVAPNEELAKHEAADLAARQSVSELEPLRTELIQINYAKASEIAAILKSKGSTAPAGGSLPAAANSLLSKRGSITIDERTNTLLVQDTVDRLADMRKLVAKLDIPVRQVLIESRIVIANNDFSRELGVRFGGTVVKKNGSDGIVSTTGSALGNDTMVGSAVTNIRSTGQAFPVTLPSLDNRLNVNLPVANPAGALGFAILGKDYLLDLELSALQAEGRGEVVSSPRVITANQKEALIEQGVEIPYQEASSSGATSVSFKKAVLSLKVTPQVTPDDRVIMDLKVNKDSVGDVFQGVPSINTRKIETQVLVDNGETVVLGGIYEQTRSNQVNKVPLLGDLPILGVLFRNTQQVDDKVELLIFVTPKILKESLGVR